MSLRYRSMSAQVNVTLKRPGSKLEHQGIKIEFVGQIGEGLLSRGEILNLNGHNYCHFIIHPISGNESCPARIITDRDIEKLGSSCYSIS